jgi:hypothetical protein
MRQLGFETYNPYYENIKLNTPEEFIDILTQKLIIIAETARKAGI